MKISIPGTSKISKWRWSNKKDHFTIFTLIVSAERIKM